jgi:hypothetical protein
MMWHSNYRAGYDSVVDKDITQETTLEVCHSLQKGATFSTVDFEKQQNVRNF